VGVAAPGRSIKMILLRTYRCLLAAGLQQYLRADLEPAGKQAEASGEAAASAGSGDAQTHDAYTTLAGYFHSPREPGGMRRIMQDDLLARTAKAEEFKPVDWKWPHPWFDNRKLKDEPVELTSRETTTAIKKSKDRLNHEYGHAEHVDALLASKMLSV